MNTISRESVRAITVRLQYSSALLASQIGIENSQDELDEAFLRVFEYGINDAQINVSEVPHLFRGIEQLEHAWSEGVRWGKSQIAIAEAEMLSQYNS